MKEQNPPLSYAEYLNLDRLMSCQSLKSEEKDRPAHDEMLFIIVHQTYELWFKQIIYELDSVRDMFQKDYIDEARIGTAVSRLGRIAEIEKLLISQLQILETMTPLDFLDFRDLLMPASGFQSFQFRLFETKLGLKSGQRLRYHAETFYQNFAPEHQKLLQQAEEEMSLAELVEKWLERTPFLKFHGFDFLKNYQAAVEKMLNHDRQILLANLANLAKDLLPEQREMELQEFQKTEENFSALFDQEKHEELVKKGIRRFSYKATLAALLIHLYRDQPILHEPFRLLTVLVDIDELLTAWRQRHALMAHRMIGTKIGTGGSSGYAYLKATAEHHKIFTDFANLSTYLIPRSKLPELPPEVAMNLGFTYTKTQKKKD